MKLIRVGRMRFYGVEGKHDGKEECIQDFGWET
jgi:hypothetical protein